MSLESKIRNFLQGPRKGETFELKNGLVSQYKYERKDSIKRVIQAMTVGKDVSSLFPDVLKNIATYDIEQKKLVYLYLMNYAKSHPELCVLAVNTFVQDTEDPNPLIRALAIRTMGCIRVSKMIDYIEIPLRRTMEDDNPYVRKTAAIGVAKLFDLNSDLCVELGFLEGLVGMTRDLNPMVIANALNALYEIREMDEETAHRVFKVDSDLVKSLLTCLNECTEWGRITVLSVLNDYQPSSSEEASHIIERIIPQLQHANPSVVLSSLKAILTNLESVKVTAQRKAILKKLSSPMVSLVTTSIPEAQYVGLKNIRIILEKYPEILSKELRVFFIKYSDPLYLKLEKLEIIVRLANDDNITLLLGELKEYAMEFETALVVKSIKSIGAVGIKLSSCVIKAVNLLCYLIDERGSDAVINESVAAMTNILRRYPGKNDLITLIVPVISNRISDLSKTEALSSYIWLLGEYPKYFSHLQEKISDIVDRFLEYEFSLQLNILNTAVKVNFSLNGKFSSTLQKVLDMATNECENADVRDKAYIYWRLLSTGSSDVQKRVILTKLPAIDTTISSFNPTTLEYLLKELSTLSSVYHKPSFTFVNPSKHVLTSSSTQKHLKNENNFDNLTKKAKVEIVSNAKNENLLDFNDDESGSDAASTGNAPSNLLDELNDLFITPSVPKTQSDQPQTSLTQDILSLFNGGPSRPSNDGKGNSNEATVTSTSKSLENDLVDLF